MRERTGGKAGGSEAISESNPTESRIRAALVRNLFSDGKEPQRGEYVSGGNWLIPGDGEAAAVMLDDMVRDVMEAINGN